MNILHRHLFQRLLMATLMAVTLFVSVLVVALVMREVLDLLGSGQMDAAFFFRLLSLMIPGVIPYALPLGLLTAVLLVIGRVCAQNEYTAMRAAGLSLWTLAAPVLLLACLGVGLCLYINWYYAPTVDRRYRQDLAELARRDPLQFFQPGIIRDFPGHVIEIDERKGEELEDVWDWELDKTTGRCTLFIHAKSGRIVFDSTKNSLVLTLFDATGEDYKVSEADDPSVRNQPVLTPQDPGQSEFTFTYPLSDLLAPPPQLTKLSLRTLPELLAARSQPPPEDFLPTATDRLVRWSTLVKMQIQRGPVGAFSVLALTLLGLPLALRVGRGENSVNLALALGLAMGYYLLLFLVTALLQNKPAWHPDLMLWAPNLLFEVCGFVLLLRAAKR